MYVPNPTASLRQIRENPSRKAWIIGGGIALGVGLVGVLAWRHYRGPGGGPEGTGQPLPPPPYPKGGGGIIHPPMGTFGGPTVPHGTPQGQPAPTISAADRQAAVADLCGKPGQIGPKSAATLLRGWALPAWRGVVQGELAPSATLTEQGKTAIRQSLHDLCALPVPGLSDGIEHFIDAAIAIDMGSHYAPAIVATGAKGRICNNLPLSTEQSLALLIDVALSDLRHGIEQTAILVGLWTCHPPAKNVAAAIGLASQITTAAVQIHDESLA